VSRNRGSFAALSLRDLAATLADARDYLLRVGAALQLIPQNATKWARFERLLEVVSAIEPDGEQRPFSKGRLRRLLTTPPIATPKLIAGEDPFEESFTAAISFYGGSYRVVLGGTAGAHAGCQLLLEAVRSLPDEPHADYKHDVFIDATVLLKLSEAICGRAGLRRWELPAHSPRTELVVPRASELERLCRAVSFSEEDLAALLGPAVDGVPRLLTADRMVIVDHDDDSPTDDRIYLFPLIEAGDGTVIVALPSGLAASITHRALARAVDRDMAEPVVKALHAALQLAMRRMFDRVRWMRVSAPRRLEEPRLVSEAFYRFDSDKVAHVVGVVDPLGDYVAGAPFGTTDFREIEEELHERFVKVRAAVRTDDSDAYVLHVVCMASLGRSFFLGFTDEAADERSALLAVAADDLDLMTRIEAPDPLGLWKFAVASRQLHEQSRVVSFSKLDEYAIYRDHSSGFYMGDEPRPTMLSISPGSGGELRAEERLRLDEHAAVLPDGEGVVDVSRWPADDKSPVYRPDHPKFHALHLVELAAPCWVVPVGETSEEAAASEDLAEAVAFWLWRCRDLIASPLTELSKRNQALVVNVRVMPQSADGEGEDDAEPTSSWLRCDAPPGQNHVTLTLLEGAWSRLRGPENRAERAMATVLVEAVHHLVGFPQAGLGDRVAEEIPSGPMKMIQVLGADDDLLLALGHAAAPRLVESADVELLLDEIGLITTDVLGLPEGPIPLSDRTKVLNRIVGELFSQLNGIASELDADGLLEYLAAEQEALSFLEARNRFLVPSQAACFGDDSAAVRRATRIAQEVTSTGPASRFIIECVTAIAPQGSQRLSLGLYDRLLALAKEIVEYGYLSDAIRYGLSSAQLSVLPSGRFGVDRAEPYQQALSAYTNLLSGRSLDDARRAFARHWAEPPGDDPPFDPTELNEAFVAEFGVAATDMSHLSGDLMDLARVAPHQVATRPLEELVAELGESLEWPTGKVRVALDLLALGPLEQFLSAKNRVDSYPWRFSRDRSAARRPLLLRVKPDGEVEAVWGARSVYRAGRYLLDLVLSGRLKQRSETMRQYVTSTRQKGNAEFNRKVADFYRGRGYEDVRENVKHVGGLRLTRPNGDEIGDIDVFVVDGANKVLLAVEVKDFEFARTPFELSNEIAKLLDGPTSAAHHHEERLSFLKDNLARLLAELGQPGPAKDWQIRGEIITSSDLIAAQFPMAEEINKRLRITAFEALLARPPRSLTGRDRAHVSKRKAHRKKRKKRR
jgi:hypothetical protein